MLRSWKPIWGMNNGLPSRPQVDAPNLLSPVSGKRGQSLVEFVLIVPLLLVLLAGAVEIGRAAYYAIAVTNAARAAVQYGAQSPVTAGDEPGIKQAALADAPMLNPADITFDNQRCECPDGTSVICGSAAIDCSGRFNTYLKVNTQLNLAPLFGFPGLPSSFTLNGEAIMRIGQ